MVYHLILTFICFFFIYASAQNYVCHIDILKAPAKSSDLRSVWPKSSANGAMLPVDVQVSMHPCWEVGAKHEPCSGSPSSLSIAPQAKPAQVVIPGTMEREDDPMEKLKKLKRETSARGQN